MRVSARSRLLLVLPLAVAAAGWCAPAAAATVAGCGSFAPPEVRVEMVLAPLATSNARTVAQLDTMPDRKPGPAGIAAGHVLGLTQAKYGQQSQIQAVFRSRRDGTVCAAPATLSVSFGFQERRLFVARELPPGTCIHREVTNHEMRHVAVDERLLREFIPKLESRLRGVMVGIGTVHAHSQDQAMATIRHPIDGALRVLMDEFTRQRDRRQALVDSVAEYKRVTRSCDGELTRYVKLERPGM